MKTSGCRISALQIRLPARWSQNLRQVQPNGAQQTKGTESFAPLFSCTALLRKQPQGLHSSQSSVFRGCCSRPTVTRQWRPRQRSDGRHPSGPCAGGPLVCGLRAGFPGLILPVALHLWCRLMPAPDKRPASHVLTGCCCFLAFTARLPQLKASLAHPANSFPVCSAVRRLRFRRRLIPGYSVLRARHRVWVAGRQDWLPKCLPQPP